MKKGLLFVWAISIVLISNAQYDFSQVTVKLEGAKKQLGGDVAALIYKDGKIVYQKEIGDFNIKTQAPIASCSKWLTAALVMWFVDQGKISLDDKVSQYLPIFAKYGKSYITIRHCLSHQTGVDSDKKGLGLLARRKYKTLEEEVDDFAAKKEIDANPGTEFAYSGVGLNIAARVLEVVGKRNFPQLMMEKITRPLSMRNTTFQIDYERAPNPSGGAYSTAADYLNFLTMMMDKGMFKGKRILSEASVDEMRKIQTTGLPIAFAPKAAEGYQYGLGNWIIEADTSGKGTVVTSPGLFGTWPMIDYCRGYACIFLVKSFLGEARKEIYMDIKTAIDAVIPANTTCN